MPNFLDAFFNQQNASTNTFIKKGSLISFNYAFWRHDAYPLVVVTDYMPGKGIRGVNLHYLTYPVVRNILNTSTFGTFSFSNIKGNAYIVSAFRSYKWVGVQNVKQFDINFVKTIVSAVRSTDPNQIQYIKKYIDDQVNEKTASLAGLNKPAQPNNNIQYDNMPKNNGNAPAQNAPGVQPAAPNNIGTTPNGQ